MTTIYTDGGCHSSTGTGGWAAIIKIEGYRTISLSGGEKDTTNNRMELTAAIKALEFMLAKEVPTEHIELTSDSKYVVNGITQWVPGWKNKGWITSTDEPVVNRDLWERLDELNAKLDISWNWVKGHAGDEINEKCDYLTQVEIAKIDEPDKILNEPKIPAAFKAKLTKDLLKAKSVSIKKDPFTITVKKTELSISEIKKLVLDIKEKENYADTIKLIIEEEI